MEWLDAHNQLSGWAQAFATLITGPLAILAAWLAYRGARMQAEATVKTQRIQLDEQKRAIACGLQAEALEVHARLAANRHYLRKAKPEELFETAVIPLDLNFYQANQGQIGLLEPKLIWPVMTTFKRALHFQADMDRVRSKGPRLDQVTNLDGMAKNMEVLAADMKMLSLEFVAATGVSRDEILARVRKAEDFTPRGPVAAGQEFLQT